MSEIIKIMIAEDFSLLLEDLSELINAQEDMQVVATASTGKEMIDLAKSIEHDIILMDIEMENTTAGIIATEYIRDWDKSEKIIYLTAHETDEFILTAMGTGAIDYMVKGIPDEELLNHIRSAYNGHSLLEGKIQQVVMQEYKRLQLSERGLLFFIQNISNLTMTERELIRYLIKGMKIREIAMERSVEVVTIKSQISTLLKKFGVSRTKEIVKKINDLNLSHLF
ncbi:two component transcriptional regulator, LuxR family [Psychrobacillus psychrotolerans]|uniref:Two component transcriptional regulator, LuxR family n=1 Tax=Psychrobacillus psychrotolerans TaxID=126156 RepID=A0A1I5Z7N5_9BACI|nr:response regulator transcription factor [Psychrobacillus psychrotolerans]SFQ52365.1 two component transcriptional regulator, LuxR family [Psychrobacillus psychrotolerans]